MGHRKIPWIAKIASESVGIFQGPFVKRGDLCPDGSVKETLSSVKFEVAGRDEVVVIPFNTLQVVTAPADTVRRRLGWKPSHDIPLRSETSPLTNRILREKE